MTPEEPPQIQFGEDKSFSGTPVKSQRERGPDHLMGAASTRTTDGFVCRNESYDFSTGDVLFPSTEFAVARWL
jgi:hypothetical protein